jgi:hypothetical protein
MIFPRGAQRNAQMASNSDEEQVVKGLDELEECIIEFIEGYKDCFPDMEIEGNKIKIPVSPNTVWTLTMKTTKTKPRM